MTEFWLGVIGLVVLIVGGVMLDSFSCKSRWEGSGMRVQYGPLKGCLIQNKDGKWIPEDSYREVTR